MWREPAPSQCPLVLAEIAHSRWEEGHGGRQRRKREWGRRRESEKGGRVQREGEERVEREGEERVEREGEERVRERVGGREWRE